MGLVAGERSALAPRPAWPALLKDFMSLNQMSLTRRGAASHALRLCPDERARRRPNASASFAFEAGPALRLHRHRNAAHRRAGNPQAGRVPCRHGRAGRRPRVVLGCGSRQAVRRTRGRRRVRARPQRPAPRPSGPGQLFPELELLRLPVVDTLELSPLAFPENPYHRLVKDYKLVSDARNDPRRDAQLV